MIMAEEDDAAADDEVDDPDETRVGAGTDGNCVERNDGTSASSSDAVSSASRGDAPSASQIARPRRCRPPSTTSTATGAMSLGRSSRQSGTTATPRK